MKVEALLRKIRYFLPSGECVLLVPGIPVPLPESAVRDLHHKAPAYITVHFDTWQETWHDDQAPIKPGFFIVFRHDGRLRGGPDDGVLGQVVKVVRQEGQWKIFTGKGLIICESLVRGVRAVNAHGQLLGAWLTKEHGLDGTKTRESRTPLADLSPEQRAEVMIRFNWSPDLFEAFATGTWPPALWTAVWGDAVPVAATATGLAAVTGVEATASATLSTPGLTVPIRRGQITIDTKTGPHDVSAWMIGDGLAVHRSWAIQGWTITHRASGKKLWSRFASKDVALDAAQRLLRLPDCEWQTEASIKANARDAIFAVLHPLPLYRSKKTRAPPRAPPT